ncbi:MAG: radical SAM protein [Planctomycetaceae bacterium]|nr:radical SAM protein [Planctomycetaceae bacterium]
MNMTDDGRVRIRHLEVDIVKGCNLKYKFCTHVSPFRKGYIPLEQLSEWFETWSKKIAPERFTILGGEPLLHPEVEKVIQIAGKYWKDSQILFVTNGMILTKKSHTVFDALRAVNARVYISKHFDDPEYNLKFQEAIDCLEQSGIHFQIFHSHQKWMGVYRIGKTETGQDKPLPFNSDFNLAWKNCIASKKCVSLVNNRLYRCASIAALQNAYREKAIGKEWEVVDSYQPLSPDCSAYDIFTHLNSGAFPKCSVCPEKFNFIKPEQFKLKAA